MLVTTVHSHTKYNNFQIYFTCMTILLYKFKELFLILQLLGIKLYHLGLEKTAIGRHGFEPP